MYFHNMTTSLERAFYFSSKAKRCLRSAIYFEELFRYPECISFSQDSIEFSGKAILEFFDVGYSKEHYMGRELEEYLGKKNNPVIKKLLYEISRAVVISDRWLQQSRNLTKYGFMHIGLSPAKAFRKEEVKLAIDDANEIVNFMNKVEIYKKFQPPIKIAILNGFAKSDVGETLCANTPQRLTINDWINHLSNVRTIDNNQKYVITTIKSCEISNEFALIINPFSETYPEFDINRKLIFDIIEDYLFNGGTFLCLNGFPFFYGWDVSRGQNIPLVEGQIIYPRRIVINNTVFVPNIPAILPFSGTLFYRRINGRTTGDTSGPQGHQGPYPVNIFQTRDDIRKFGRFITNRRNINVEEFRAMTHDTQDCIPILRADRPPFGEVYPIAAKKHGRGYLISCGMRINRVSDKNKIFKATDRFLDWINRNNNL